MATTYLLGEFRDKDSASNAVIALRAAGVTDADMDLFSEEPLELRHGVLFRPTKMSMAAIAGAIVVGASATLLMRWAQKVYPVNTGGMPTYSSWGTGVITYELTMLGAVITVFAVFLWESGLIRKRDKTKPVPIVPPESICLRVRVSGDVTKQIALLEANGAVTVERKAPL